MDLQVSRLRFRIFYFASSFFNLLLFLHQFLVCFPFVQASVRYDSIQLYVAAEQPSGTLVGTIPRVSGLTYRFTPDSTAFSIDGISGVITTKTVLHVDSFPTGTATLVVQSLPIPSQQIIQVQITITAAKNNGPKFSQSQVAITFKEIDPVGTQVPLQMASNTDTGIIVRYEIISGNDAGRFKLVFINDSNDPLLYLSNTVILSRSQQPSYLLNISAQDGAVIPQYGYLSVNVTILGTNGNTPIFNESTYFVTLNKSADVGSFVVRVWATDSFANADIVYSLINDNDNQFAIDAASGVVTTLKSLNCDSSCSGSFNPDCNPNVCVLTVEASDFAQPYPLTGSAFISVTLLDQNAQSPVISFHNLDSNGELVLDERTLIGTVVEAVSVTDQDGSSVSVEMVAGNDHSDFRLETTGIKTLAFIVLAQSLDLYHTSRYNLTIEARDAGSPPLSSIAFLIIIVNASNGNPPVFDQQLYTCTLSELAPVGSFVAAVTAHSVNSNMTSYISYSISSGNSLDWFSVNDKTGLVTTKCGLDKQVASGIVLLVQAMDGTNSAFANVSVTIVDGNDEAPQFNYNPYYVTLAESNQPNRVIVTVSASYGDGRGNVVFRLHPDTDDVYPDMFQVNELSGQVVALQALDREQYSNFFVKVIARNKDNPSRSSTATVLLNVTNVNDNRPIFDPLFYVAQLPGAAQNGASIVQVSATDRDLKNNSVLRYTILAGADQVFVIDGLTGWISLATPEIGSLAQSAFVLSVIATDLGGLTCLRPSTVLISVNNSQVSQSLTFSSFLGYSFDIVEDDGRFPPNLGRTVGQVDVESNSVLYYIVDGDPEGIFIIVNNTGVIKTAAAVDRESTPFYSLVIVAAAVSAYGSTNINITVLDLNDNIPTFPSATAEVDVDENRPIGEDIFVGRASDSDAGTNGSILYSLTSKSSTFFTIDNITGLVLLSQLLDSRTTNVFMIYIVASDDGSPPLSSIQVVTIEIQIVNDHTPFFNQSQYTVAVNENDPVNDRFFCVVAMVANIGAAAMVTYSITYGNNDGRVKIFPDGCVYISSELDREVCDMYVLTVQASVVGVFEDIRSSTCDLVVVVLDANDNDPLFWNSTYHFVIIEGSPAEDFSVVFLASDADIGRNAELLFSIEGSDYGFSVDPLTSLLTTSRVFNREQLLHDIGTSIINITLVATDCGIPSRHSHVLITFFIADVNDNPPKFQQYVYDVVIPENTVTGTILTSVTATDPDAGPNAMVSYAIVDGNDGTFSLDNVTGQLTLVASLDSEKMELYVLTIMAYDSGISFSLNTTTVVRVTVEDVRDELPVWIQFPSYGLNISRNAEVGELVGRVVAVDGNVGFRVTSDIVSDITYRIVADDSSLPFLMESFSGNIFLIRQLSNTTKQMYSLNVTVGNPVDPPSLWISSVLLMNIIDYNDHTPQFLPGSSVFYVADGVPVGTYVFTVFADDVDYGNDAVMEYSIVKQIPSGRNFSIDGDTGFVVVNSTLRCCEGTNFQLVISAIDVAMTRNVRLSSQKLFTILVISLNDYIPQFLAPNAAVVALGSAPGTLVTTVKAVISESGNVDLIMYDIVSGDSDVFMVDSDSGDIYLRMNLSLQVLSYNLTIRAIDKIHPLRSSTLQLTILVTSGGTDVLNFSQFTYSGQINENQSKGTSVLTIYAAYSTSPSDSIEYYITNITSNGQRQLPYFQVDVKSGSVTSTEPLDREIGFTFNLEIYAIDRSSKSPHTGRTQVLISLLDVNDNVPVFVSYADELTISEAIPVGSVISNIRAIDPDTTGSLLYSITSGADDGRLGIISSSGDLMVVRGLDSANVSLYTLTIEATDGLHSSEVTVLVNVLNVAEQTLEFSLPFYTFDVPEDSPTGARVGRVSASDLSSGPASYALVSQSAQSEFSIDSVYGVILLQESLDYENLNLYTMTLSATKGSKTVMIIAYVNVLDVNDNDPIFNLTVFKAAIWENVQPGTSIVCVEATDADTDVNSQIKYEITSGDPDGQFVVDENTGVVEVFKSLDHEKKSFYNLVITATDQPKQVMFQRTSTAVVSVVVMDFNDNPPVFITPAFVTVMENATVGSSVFRIIAKDIDTGLNSQITYSLIEGQTGQGQNVFSINSSSGVVTLLSHLDRESISNYNVTVTASDNGTPQPLLSTLNMTIVVGDLNDHSPVFNPTTYSTTVSEETPTGSTLLTVSATDLDIGLNGEIRFVVADGDVVTNFLLDSYTGELTVRFNLDYKEIKFYTLTIIAHDLGQPQRSSTAIVAVTLIDTHDFTPVFIGSPFTIFAYEGLMDLPVTLTQLSSTDFDSTSVNRLSYQLQIQPDNNLPFYVNSTTGVVMATETLNREAKSDYSFNVIAVDSGYVPNTGTATVTILVADANDFAPVFDQDRYKATVVEKLPSGSTVVQIHATDADIGRNGEVRYSLIEDGVGQFTVDIMTGLISTSAVLDWQFADHYDLVAMAKDRALIPKNGTVSIRVTVIDLNDHTPQFLQSTYQMQMRDPTTADSFVIGITALDPDDGLNGTVVYSIINGSNSFAVDTNTGVINAKQSLMSSQGPESYSFYVKASDLGQPPKVNITHVVISFLPSQTSGFPSFQTLQRNFTIPENITVGMVVTVMAATSPKGNVALQFVISGGNVDSSFGIDDLGRVIVVRSLNFKRVKVYNLWLEVKDLSGLVSLSGYTALSIVVTETNYDLPEFDLAYYNTSVLEQQIPPVDVTTVHATDSDPGSSGIVVYSLATTDGSSMFTIDPKTGNIQTTETLIYQTAPKYLLVVIGTDFVIVGLSSNVTVQVNVISISNNPPKFTDLFSASVRENAPVGTFVLRVTATDMDPGAIITYSLSTGLNSNPNLNFTINATTGIITTTTMLDAALQSEYLLRVAANDGVFNIETTVTVYVLEANIRTPFCDQLLYYYEIVENPSLVVTVGNITATDLEMTSPNRDTFFRLRYPSHLLGVYSANDTVFTRQPSTSFVWSGRNPSAVNLWHVTLSAVDRGMPPLSSTCEFFLQVQPPNLFAPTFSQMSYDAAVPTNASIGFSILTLSAQDNDTYLPNAIIHYTLNNGSNFFNLDSATGILILKSIFTGKLTIIVTAEDGGIPKISTQVEVRVHVTPFVSFFPSFVGQPQSFVATVSENATIGTIVATVVAVDTDPDDTGSLLYDITGGNSKDSFFMLQANGTIIVAQSLNYRQQHIYVLQIRARIPGAQARESHQSFTVMVIDVYGFVPIFDKSSYKAFVFENVPIGTPVLELNASYTDSSETSDMSYEIIGNPDSIIEFNIDEDTGIITTKNLLDYRQMQEYSLNVCVTNPVSGSSSTCAVNVSILPVNRFAPQFTKTIYTFVLSTPPVAVGTTVGSVDATDEDPGYYGMVEYFLVSDSNQYGFTIDVTSGILIVSDANVAGMFANVSLLVLAKNPGPVRRKMTDVCTIVILTPGSSSRPLSFNKNAYQATLLDDVPVGTDVVMVISSDGNGDVITYSIIRGNTNNAFVISSQTGWIQVNRKLSHLFPLYNITVQAATVSQLATTTSVIIIILDANSNGSNTVYQCLTTLPCQNGGSCLPNLSGYSCVCLFGARGSDCGVGSVSFAPLAFMEFRLTLDSLQNSIAFEVATISNQSLLAFYLTGNEGFLAVEIIAGQIRFSFAGDDGVIYRVVNQILISDGQWYRVEAKRNATVALVKVSDCRVGYAECDLCPDGDLNCSSALTLTSPSNLLSSNPLLAIGGTSDFQIILNHTNQISTHDFIGCLRNMTIDGINILSVTPISSNLTTNSCQRSSKGSCQPNPCLNAGVCIDQWINFRCQCPVDFDGELCENASSPFTFGAGAYFVLHQKEQYRRDQLLLQLSGSRRKRQTLLSTASHEMSITIRTNSPQGMLLYSETTKNDFTILQIKDSYIVYESGDNVLTNPVKVSDSSWHTVSLMYQGLTVTLTVDKSTISQTFDSSFHDPLGLNVTIISIGGTLEPVYYNNDDIPGFNGCMNNLLFDGQNLSPDGDTDRFTIEQIGAVKTGCLLATMVSPVNSTPSWEIIAIVVGALLLVLLVGLLFFFFVCQRKKETLKQNGKNLVSGNDRVLDHMTSNGVECFRESLEPVQNIGLKETVVFPLKKKETGRRQMTLSMQPDVIVPETRNWFEIGFDNDGFTADALERYDIENASSIAPSDLADVVSHDKRYRNGILRNQDQRLLMNTGFLLAAQHDAGSLADPAQKNQTRENSNYTVVENNVKNDVNHVFRSSPSKQVTRESPVSNVLDKPGFRVASPTKRPSSRGACHQQHGSVRSTPLTGISELFPSSSSTTDSSTIHQPRTTTSRMIDSRRTPTVGLTLEEVNQLNASNRCTPASAMDTVSMSMDQIPPNVINTTDFTHNDLLHCKTTTKSRVANDSSSEDDETNNDTFTCSEFEVDRNRLKNGFTNPNRLAFAPPPMSSRPNKYDNRHKKTTKNNASTFENEGRKDVYSVDMDALNTNYLLSWGAHFQELVGVCIEISQLPDAKDDCRTRRSSVSPSTNKYKSNPTSNVRFQDGRPSSISPFLNNSLSNLRTTSNLMLKNPNQQLSPAFVSPNEFIRISAHDKVTAMSPSSFEERSHLASCRPSSSSRPNSKSPASRVTSPANRLFSPSSPIFQDDANATVAFVSKNGTNIEGGIKEEYV